MVNSTVKIRQALNKAQVIDHGHFIFAAGSHATTKIDMDHLWEHPEQLKLILDALARADGLPPADIILGVPRGGQYLADTLGAMLKLPVARLERIPGGAKQDFRFVNQKDRRLALNARSPRIYEDVVTTLSSVAGVVKLLNPAKQNIHCLAIWLRGKVQPEFAKGVTAHFLLKEFVLDFPPGLCTVCAPATTQ